MAWTIEFTKDANKELRQLDPQSITRIVSFITDRLSLLDNPRSIGEALHGPGLGRYWKYRVGDFRIICDIQDKQIVIVVVRIGNRREVYR